MLFPVKKIFWGLIGAVILLMAIYTFNTISINFLTEPLAQGFVEKFDIDHEANLPTWFSTALLFMVAGSAFLILLFHNQRTDSLQTQRMFWLIFSGMFLFLSLDEGAQVHELIDEFTQVKWVFIYAPFALAFFAYCATSLQVKKLVPSAAARWILGGLVLFAIGGLLMEWFAYRFSLPYALRQVRFVVEEAGEMLGVIFILRGCLMEVNGQYNKTVAS